VAVATASSGGGTTTNALTMNNSGTGAASGATFNGSAAQTISFNTIGAQQALTLTTTGTSGAATLSAGALNIPNYTAGGGAFPQTVSGTTTSGGIPFFASTTSLASSGVLNANVLVKGGGAGTAPTNSLLTDTGTTATYTGTGGIASPGFTSTGTTAGFMDFPQGTTSSAVAPCNTATSICFQAPTAVTSQLRTLAGTPATGFSLWTNTSGSMVETITGTQGTLSSGGGLLGTLAVNSVLASTVAAYAGHFTNLQVVTELGGTCTTPPVFNVFDGTTNVGSTVTAGTTTQTKGTGTSTAQTQTFAAGDVIGVFISTAGATCVANQYIVTAQYSTP
jgi:hypothetical protein